jgi:hypothetical protein
MSEANGRIKIDPTIALQIVAWIVAGLVTYGAINARVSVVESQMDTFKADVQEMKQDIKTLLRRP